MKIVSWVYLKSRWSISNSLRTGMVPCHRNRKRKGSLISRWMDRGLRRGLNNRDSPAVMVNWSVSQKAIPAWRETWISLIKMRIRRALRYAASSLPLCDLGLDVVCPSGLAVDLLDFGENDRLDKLCWSNSQSNRREKLKSVLIEIVNWRGFLTEQRKSEDQRRASERVISTSCPIAPSEAIIVTRASTKSSMLQIWSHRGPNLRLWPTFRCQLYSYYVQTGELERLKI